MSAPKLSCIGFSRTELDHLLTLLRDERRSGSYYGNREQYYRRNDRLFKVLTEGYSALTGNSYPLEPSNDVTP